MHPVMTPGDPRIAFAGVSTTGLCAEMHEIWEAALIVSEEGREQVYTWQLPINLERTDPAVLELSHFRGRRLPDHQLAGLSGFADALTELTVGVHLVCVRAEFTGEFLRRLLHRHGCVEGWHHLVDAESLAAGRLATPPPWDLRKLSSVLGVNVDQFATDTAIGNAQWAKAVYEATVGVCV
jgi:hypothetical protein